MSLPFVFHPDYVTPLPDGHRFPMPKFGRVYETIVRDGIASLDQFHMPQKAGREWIELVHDASFVDAYLTGSIDPKAMRRIGFPWSAALVHRTCTAVGGTVLAAELALEHGMACQTAGGTHHAHAGYGSGFCIFNDLAVAAAVVRHNGLAQRVFIVDLDVHQGDGTATIFQHEADVFTLSVHCGANFPYRKQTSDHDLDVPVGTEDDTYLRMVECAFPDLLDHFRPDLVLYDGGVDPHQRDRLGKLALSDRGLYRRDTFIFRQCLRRGYPVACVVGGGYDHDVDALARRHALMHRAASDVFHELRM